MLSPLPKVVWAPGVGLIGVGASLKEARTVTDLAEQNIRVMADGVANGGFTPVQAQDLFDMEYWSLEQAKIGKSRPPEFQGRVVMVTGGGGAIGEAIAHAFRQPGRKLSLSIATLTHCRRAPAGSATVLSRSRPTSPRRASPSR